MPGFTLPARNIYVGILPHYKSDIDMRDSDIANVTRKMMELARCMLLRRIAIPLLETGKVTPPRSKIVRLMAQGIVERLSEDFEEVRLCAADKDTAQLFAQRLHQMGWKG